MLEKQKLVERNVCRLVQPSICLFTEVIRSEKDPIAVALGLLQKPYQHSRRPLAVEAPVIRRGTLSNSMSLQYVLPANGGSVSS
jgi:hypothetical protein